jgi:ribose 5-phosphate isomerase B
MKIAIGADHRGHTSARSVADRLTAQGHQVQVLGPLDGKSCDYPERAYLVGRAVAGGQAELGVLICGTGIGMAIAANKVRGVRAAVVHDEMTAQLSRSHNDANVLCLSADLLGQRLIDTIVDTWVGTEFEGGRHARRIHKVEAIEQGKDPATIVD